MDKLTKEEAQKLTKELSDIRDETMSLVKKYNRLASKNNFSTRLGVASAEAYCETEDDDGNPIDVEEYVSNNYIGEGASVSVNAPDADAWFPSSFC